MNIVKFATDKELELRGVWHDIGQGARVLVARDNNPEYVKALRIAMSPYRSAVQRKNLDDEVANDIMCDLVARTILLDWENIDNEDGSAIPYSYENAKMLLKEYPDFQTMITTFAAEADFYRKKSIQEITENAKKS